MRPTQANSQVLNEKWLDVPGYERMYQASNLGRVRSVDHLVKCNSGTRLVKGRILKQADRGNGYAFVTFGKDGKQKNVSVHRIVAQLFVPNPNGLPEVNHKDENGMNPAADNLEWCDRKYNNNYGSRIVKTAMKTSKTIIQTDKNGYEIARYKSLSDASATTGIQMANISCCCNGKRTFAGGYRWRYEIKKEETNSEQTE